MNLRLDGLRLQLLGLFILPVALLVLAVAIVATGLHRQAMRSLVAERDERAVAAAAAGLDHALQANLEALELSLSMLPKDSSIEAVADQAIEDLFPLGHAFYDQQGRPLSGTLLTDEQLPSHGTPENRIIATTLNKAPAVLFFAEQDSAQLIGASPLREIIRAAGIDIAGSRSDLRVYLVDQDSRVLISLGEASTAPIRNHAGVEASLRGERGSTFLPMADGEHVVAYAPIPSASWGLIMEEPWESVTSSLLDLSLLAPFSLVPILLLTMLGLWFGARRVIRPLQQLDEAASSLPTGEADTITQSIGGIHEIEQLRETLVRMSNRIQETQAALRSYINALTDAQEEERRRVARELHDESIQHWIALGHRLQIASERLKNKNLEEAELISELHKEVQAGIQELRRLSRGLRPIYLEDLGLIPAIEMLARDTQDVLGIPVEVIITGDTRRLSNQMELTLYRLVQEGLTNLSRHAQANQASIKIAFQPGSLELTIQDDGVGFNPPVNLEKLTTHGHYGLMGMKERADSIGGTLTIDSSSVTGTTIHLSVPISNG